mmetsp:Transcript_6226/g.15776  ORF Transcript_6226/g.15776 Transcript_6226/m.15776 type:complete len:81 (-) Transcript_6226:59-301(-)
MVGTALRGLSLAHLPPIPLAPNPPMGNSQHSLPSREVSIEPNGIESTANQTFDEIIHPSIRSDNQQCNVESPQKLTPMRS